MSKKVIEDGVSIDAEVGYRINTKDPVDLKRCLAVGGSVGFDISDPKPQSLHQMLGLPAGTDAGSIAQILQILKEMQTVPEASRRGFLERSGLTGLAPWLVDGTTVISNILTITATPAVISLLNGLGPG